MTRTLRRKGLFCFIFVLLSVLSFQSVQAQEYPTNTLIESKSAPSWKSIPTRLRMDWRLAREAPTT